MPTVKYLRKERWQQFNKVWLRVVTECCVLRVEVQFYLVQHKTLRCIKMTRWKQFVHPECVYCYHRAMNWKAKCRHNRRNTIGNRTVCSLSYKYRPFLNKATELICMHVRFLILVAICEEAWKVVCWIPCGQVTVAVENFCLGPVTFIFQASYLWFMKMGYYLFSNDHIIQNREKTSHFNGTSLQANF